MAEHAGDANQTSNQHQRAGTSPYSPRRSNRDGVPTLPTLPQRIASASSWSRSPGIHCPPAARPYAGSSDRSFASSTATLTPYPDHGSPTGWSIATLDTLDTGPDAEDAPVIRKASLAQELLKGVHKKRLRGNRWMSRPREGAHDEWVHEEDRATEWLSLFYDLIVVAVLGIFMTQHEIETPTDIPIFLSFFTIIFWTWCSQTAYDMRFQGDDALHRSFKFLQVILFIYQGASSANWNPGKIEVWAQDAERNAEDYGAKLASHQDAARSWLTVVLAFAVSRGVLAVQYGICAYQGSGAGRPIRHILLTIDALCISLILAITSAALPSTSYHMKVAKIAIFYLAIFIEMADEWGQVLLKVTHRVPTERIGERYGAFLLIIIGEGIIMITRAFNKAIGGLSDDDTSTYLLVFLTIVVVYLLWSFLFSNFDKFDHTGHGRVAIWQTLHFPLTFTILLLMAGMVNVVVVTSAAHGIKLVLTDVGAVARETLLTGHMPVEEIKRANRYMYKLALEPSFPEQIEYLDRLQDQLDPIDDWYIVLDQYIGQIVYNTFKSYDLNIPDGAQELYTKLYAANTSWHPSEQHREQSREHADELLAELVGHIMVDIFTGVLWILPASGCVLVLCALRSMTWYRFAGIAHNLLHLPQIIFGIALSLLGVLDLGPKGFDVNSLDSKDHFTSHVNPLYRVILDKVPLVIVAVVYCVVWLITAGGLWWTERREQRAMDEGEVQAEELGDRPESEGAGWNTNGFARSCGRRAVHIKIGV